MARWVRFESFAFVFILIASLSVYRSAAYADPGTFWHTRCGLLMIDRGELISVDEFTAPFAGQEWRPQQWLAEIGMAGLYRIGEWDTPLLAFCTLLAGLYSWVIARLREAGVPLILAVLAAVMIWLGAYFHAFIRPHMITILLTGWTLARLIDFDRGRIGLRGVCVLIPVNILWTNLHGGVIGGLMMHAICGVGWLVLFILKRSSPISSWPQAGWFCVISILCALAPIVNPYGLGMFRIWSKIVGSKAMKTFVVEHQPLDWRDGSGQWVIGTVAVYVFFVLTTRGRGFRITWLMPLIWFALSFSGIRQGPLAMITALVAMADVWPHSIGRYLLVVSPVDRGRRWLVLPLALVGVFLGIHAAGIRCPLIGRGWAMHNDATWPVSILPQIRSAVANVPAGSAIYNDTSTGGFLIWHAPALKIFIDDRFELCGDDWLRAYCEAAAEQFDVWDAQYDFRLALVSSSEDHPAAFETLLLGRPTQWREIARHPVAVLFEKIKP